MLTSFWPSRVIFFAFSEPLPTSMNWVFHDFLFSRLGLPLLFITRLHGLKSHYSFLLFFYFDKGSLQNHILKTLSTNQNVKTKVHESLPDSVIFQLLSSNCNFSEASFVHIGQPMTSAKSSLGSQLFTSLVETQLQSCRLWFSPSVRVHKEQRACHSLCNTQQWNFILN